MKKKQKDPELKDVLEGMIDEIEGLSKEMAQARAENAKMNPSYPEDQNRPLPYLAHMDNKSVHKFINFRDESESKG